MPRGAIFHNFYLSNILSIEILLTLIEKKSTEILTFLSKKIIAIRRGLKIVEE